jgi:Cell division protein FtsI/penicillin-binding protein 2
VVRLHGQPLPVGKATGIEQGYEAEGIVPHPNNGDARNLTYANTTFGQAMTATPLQMAAAYAAMLNGGTYYQPRLVDKIIAPDGTETAFEPKVLAENVVKPSTSEAMRPLLEYVVENHSIGSRFDQSVYSVGGKTGTAQVPGPDGRYKESDYNGTYVGFVGGDKPEYIISIVIYEPKIPGYAGSVAAQPLFADLAEMLIYNFWRIAEESVAYDR